MLLLLLFYFLFFFLRLLDIGAYQQREANTLAELENSNRQGVTKLMDYLTTHTHTLTYAHIESLISNNKTN